MPPAKPTRSKKKPSPSAPASAALAPAFADWFAARGWTPRAHQLACLDAARAGASHLLIAPTGGGKTLAGFLPSLEEIAARDRPGARARRVHTIYVSPLKALAVDVARNVATPIEEMGLDGSVETRTGDTPPARRQRQKINPPDILLTTPEQISLMLSNPDSFEYFAGLKAIVLDELHAIAYGKRGHLLSLALSRLHAIAPDLRVTGLSATVADADPLLRFLTPQNRNRRPARLIRAAGGAEANVRVLNSERRIPWSGHSARHAWAEVYDAIKEAGLTLVFVNTRSQAELTFQALWRLNDDNLPIALHHGSLDVARRRKVEAAMTRGDLRAVVCTSTLDLGIDWGDVDLVIQIGAPKGASRLTQRIGRANHRMNEPSRALMVPDNRFSVLECLAARDAIEEGALDGEPLRDGTLDVLAQHVMCVACAAPFRPEDLYTEVSSAAPYAELDRATFDQVVNFVATGGYALKSYDRYRRIVEDADGAFRIRNQRFAQQHRLNAGTIVEAPALNVRLAVGKPPRPGRILGTMEEWFFEGLTPGDTFLFAGEVLRFVGAAGADMLVVRAPGAEPRVPSWAGGKFPLSSYLAGRVRKMIEDRSYWPQTPGPIREWLELQAERSVIPGEDELLVETFPNGNRFFLVCYPFDGVLAHQTLGTLITRRLERGGAQPLGFVATEYSLSVWGRRDMERVDMGALFDEDMLGDDLEEWLSQSFLMKRTFRNCAMISGLVERRHPGQEKSGKQVTFSSDLIFDVLREHEPDHILLKAAWADAAGGYLDLARLSGLLARVKGRIRHAPLEKVSPLAVPVMLEINKDVIVGGDAQEQMLKEASDALIAEAMGQEETGHDEKGREKMERDE
ncbi:MAG: ligase-associated DNA damage response DEXH box helicase [Parvularculaceae bacterium]